MGWEGRLNSRVFCVELSDCLDQVAQRLKCLPAMRETWVRSLGGEDPLGKEMATHSGILARIIPRPEELGRYCPWVYEESDMTEQLRMHT